MTLLTAHKVFISTAIVMFLIFAAREFQRYTNGDAGALAGATVGFVAAAGLAVYLRRVWMQRPSSPSRR